jgi:hypothetical protein
VTARNLGPRFATLADDGWSLLDVERAYRRRDGVYWVPPAETRRGLRPGALAKLLFAWADPGPDDPGREGMWVEIERAEEDGSFVGRLVNEPVAVAPIGAGAWVRAGPAHVADVVSGPRGEPLSEQSDLLRCDGHGWSEPCFVCAHVTLGEGLGFHEGDDPARLRPHAWCDACDAIVTVAGGWGRAEVGLPVVRVCGGCYDRFRGRNRRARG